MRISGEWWIRSGRCSETIIFITKRIGWNVLNVSADFCIQFTVPVVCSYNFYLWCVTLDIFFLPLWKINKRIYLWKIAYPEDCFIGVDALLFYGGRSTDTCQSGKRKEHKSNTVIPVVKGNVTDTLSLVSFNDFHGAFACDKGVPGAGQLVQTVLTQKEKIKYHRAFCRR